MLYALAFALALSGWQSHTPWVQVGGNPRLVVYAEREGRRNGNNVVAWVLYDYKQVQVSPRSGRRYSTEKTQNEFDCGTERGRRLHVTWHSGRMGDGTVVYESIKTGEWDMNAPGSIALGLLTYYCGGGSQSQAAAGAPSSLEALTKLASELNKSLPMMVDRDTELTNTGGLPGVVVYNYRFTNWDASEIDTKTMTRTLRPVLVNRACSTPQTRDDLLKRGIAMRFSYYDRSGVFLFSIDVKLAECDVRQWTFRRHARENGIVLLPDPQG